MPLRSIAFLAWFCGSCGLALAVPMAGVICYIALYHIYPQTTWWGIALEPLGIRYAYIAGACLVIGTLLNLNRLPFGRRMVHPVEWGVLLTALVMLLSTALGTGYDGRTAMLVDKMAKVFLFTMVLTHVVVTRRLLWHLVLTFGLLALYLGHEAHIAPPSAFAENRLNGIGGPDFRESAGLAIHLFALLPFVAVLFRQKGWWLKGIAFFAACYAVNAILLCRARSAFVAGLAAGVMALWYAPKRYRRWVGGMLVLGAIGGVVLSDEFFWNRMTTIMSGEEERDKSAATRLVIWQAAWQMLQDRPLGVGVGQFERQIGNYALDVDAQIARRDAHNSFVLCAGETGVLGLIAYVGTLGLSWWTLARLVRRVRAEVIDGEFFELLILANRLSLVVYAVGGLFVSRFYTEGAWMLIVLPVCLSRAVENEVKQETRELAAVAAELNALSARGLLPQLA